MSVLIQTPHYSVHQAGPLPQPLPPLDSFLGTSDIQWLKKCSHKKRKQDFLKGRWKAYEWGGRGERLDNGYLSYPQSPIAITHKHSHVLIGKLKNPTPPLLRPSPLLGIDLEQKEISSKLAHKLLAKFPHLTTTPLMKTYGAYAFSAQEALWKAWGRYHPHQPPLSTWILKNLKPTPSQHPHNGAIAALCHFEMEAKKDASSTHEEGVPLKDLLHPPFTVTCYQVTLAKKPYVLSVFYKDL